MNKVDEWSVGGITVFLTLGPFDDAELDLSVKTEKLLPDIGGITIIEPSSAKQVEFWPSVSVKDLNRRKTLYEAVKNLLKTAEESEAKDIGFFTMGLEVSRVPSWEVAEELVKAIKEHGDLGSSLKTIILVAGSPTQISSFHYALDNQHIISIP